MNNELKYAAFDKRMIQELEQRNEFLCSGGTTVAECAIGFGLTVGGLAAAIFGAGPAAAPAVAVGAAEIASACP